MAAKRNGPIARPSDPRYAEIEPKETGRIAPMRELRFASKPYPLQLGAFDKAYADHIKTDFDVNRRQHR